MLTAQAFQEGQILLINKPLQWTSHDVVARLRGPLKNYCSDKKFKIGHAGTLDPLATGLLLVLTGKATKLAETLQGLEKEYTGTITLGASTPSFDAETAITNILPTEHITPSAIYAMAKQFEGNQDQVPPIYSSVKVDGVRAYDYARGGDELVMKSRNITLFAFEITALRMPEVDFKVHCSKGTYIRSLAHDFGNALGCGGYLTALCRTAVGKYRIKDATTIEAVLQGLQS